MSRARHAGRPFFGMIDSVLVDSTIDFDFEGGISREHAWAAWNWIVRDIAPDLIDPEADETDPEAVPALEALLPELLTRVAAAQAEANKTHQLERRIKVQFGSEEAYRRLPVVVNALNSRNLIKKAVGFGRAIKAMTEDEQLDTALQAMPIHDQPLFALLMQAAVGQVASPSKLTVAATRIAGSSSEIALARAGYGPVVEAILGQAQNQIVPMGQRGHFADVDLVCRAIERFHRLARAVNSFVELGRGSRWAVILGTLTKQVSERIEPRLRDVVMDVNLALRYRREGTDRLDSDQLLSALNGMYVLATVRESRDSLALNAIFDKTWAQIGQALEIHIQRNLDNFRENPDDRIIGERLDAAIKMAELRFNVEYADVLRRAKEASTLPRVKPASVRRAS